MISGLASNSFIRFFTLSSNCPLYLVPATILAISSATTRLLCNTEETLPDVINCANPSTIALLPTPGSPINIGLFFFLRHNISCKRIISFSLPTTGSIFPSLATLVKSIAKASITGVFPFAFLFCLPSVLTSLASSLSTLSSSSLSSDNSIPFNITVSPLSGVSSFLLYSERH